MDEHTLRILSALCAVAATFSFACSGCKSDLSVTRAQDDATHSKKHDSFSWLIKQVEVLRDRRFKSKPAFVRTSQKKLNTSVMWMPVEVAAERALLRRMLFVDDGHDVAPLVYAHYDPISRTIQYNPDAEQEELAAAMRQSLVAALDHQYFHEPSRATSWDSWLAERAATFGDRLFVLALHELAVRTNRTWIASTLARRPDVALEAPRVRAMIAQGDAADASLIALEQGFVAREGFALTSALHRINAWSGAELLHQSAPHTTVGVVQSARWLSGEGAGQWDWPTLDGEMSWTERSHGRVGAAVGSFFTHATLGASSRMLPHAWLDDHYTYYTRHEGKAEMILWIVQWSTPHIARQMESLFSQTLYKRMGQIPDRRFGVWTSKSSTVLIAGRGISKSELDALQSSSMDARVRFPMEDDRILLKYMPSDKERLFKGHQEMVFGQEDRIWRDPALGVRMTLLALPKDWRVEINRRGGAVRWYARSARDKEGVLLQWTAELPDLLGPEFSSKAYALRFRHAMESSLKPAKMLSMRRIKVADRPTIELKIEGVAQGKMRRFAIWHIQDTQNTQNTQNTQSTHMLYTFSMTSSHDQAKEHDKIATQILGTLKFEAQDIKDFSKSKGILEFKAED